MIEVGQTIQAKNIKLKVRHIYHDINTCKLESFITINNVTIHTFIEVDVELLESNPNVVAFKTVKKATERMLLNNTTQRKRLAHIK